jgi:hypothetical protein
MQAKDLQPGDVFYVWEQDKRTACLKTEDGHTYRLKDGSVFRVYPTKNVELQHGEEAGFKVVEYQGRAVLAQKLPGNTQTARYIVKTFIPVETLFVVEHELSGVEETPSPIRNEVTSPAVLAMAPQVLVMLQEIEAVLSRGASFVQVVKVLLQAGQVDHNQITVNLKQLPGK